MTEHILPQEPYMSVSVDNLQASIQFYTQHASCALLYRDDSRALLAHGNYTLALVKTPPDQLAAEIALEHQAAAQMAIPFADIVWN